MNRASGKCGHGRMIRRTDALGTGGHWHRSCNQAQKRNENGPRLQCNQPIFAGRMVLAQATDRRSRLLANCCAETMILFLIRETNNSPFDTGLVFISPPGEATIVHQDTTRSRSNRDEEQKGCLRQIKE